MQKKESVQLKEKNRDGKGKGKGKSFTLKRLKVNGCFADRTISNENGTSICGTQDSIILVCNSF